MSLDIDLTALTCNRTSRRCRISFGSKCNYFLLRLYAKIIIFAKKAVFFGRFPENKGHFSESGRFFEAVFRKTTPIFHPTVENRMFLLFGVLCVFYSNFILYILSRSSPFPQTGRTCPTSAPARAGGRAKGRRRALCRTEGGGGCYFFHKLLGRIVFICNFT